MGVSYDSVAKIYDATRWAGVPAPVMKNILDAMRDALTGCRNILDVGTGTGRCANFFEDAGFTVIGVDVSLSVVAEGREKGGRKLVQADARHLPWRGESFVGAIMIQLLPLVEDCV